MSRSITVTADVSDAPYATLDRVFHRLTFTVTVATNIEPEIFVVDTTRGGDSPLIMYTATPQDMQTIPNDTANVEGLLRVATFSVDIDNLLNVQSLIAEIQQRVRLLLESLDTLDTVSETFTFSVTT